MESFSSLEMATCVSNAAELAKEKMKAAILEKIKDQWQAFYADSDAFHRLLASIEQMEPK